MVPTQRAQGSLALWMPGHSSGGSDAVHGQCQRRLRHPGHRCWSEDAPREPMLWQGLAEPWGLWSGWEVSILPPAAGEPWLAHRCQGDTKGGRMKRKEQGQEVPSWLCWAAPAAHGWGSVLVVTSGAGGWTGHPSGAFGEVKETEIQGQHSCHGKDATRTWGQHQPSTSLRLIHHMRQG